MMRRLVELARPVGSNEAPAIATHSAKDKRIVIYAAGVEGRQARQTFMQS